MRYPSVRSSLRLPGRVGRRRHREARAGELVGRPLRFGRKRAAGADARLNPCSARSSTRAAAAPRASPPRDIDDKQSITDAARRPTAGRGDGPRPTAREMSELRGTAAAPGSRAAPARDTDRCASRVAGELLHRGASRKGSADMLGADGSLLASTATDWPARALVQGLTARTPGKVTMLKDARKGV